MKPASACVLACALALAIGGCDDGSDALAQRVAQLEHALDTQRDRRAALEREAADLADENRRMARELDRIREATERSSAVVIEVPRVGTLTWRCNDARRFSFTFLPEGATITVEESIDGETRRKVLHPGRELTTPFVHRDAHLEWTVTYRHKPASISAGISADPDVKRGACFIRNATLERTEVPH